MERDGQKVLEFFIALVFIAVLILIVVLATNSISEKKVVSSNSNTGYAVRDNTPSYQCCNNNCPVQVKSGEMICEDVQVPYTVTQNPSYVEYTYTNKNLDLSYTSRQEVKEWCNIAGQKIKQYVVYVKNIDHQGGYFGVHFKFYDYYGNEWTDYQYEYIQPGQEKAMKYTHIREDFIIDSWKYEVEAENKKIPDVTIERSAPSTNTFYQTERRCYYNVCGD